MKVHPDFSKRIWSAVRDRVENDQASNLHLVRWRNLCEVRRYVSERPRMTSKQGRIKPLLSELSIIEFENRRLLDDDSLRLLAEVRSRNLLNDDEWIQIKQFLREALEFLSGPQKTVTYAVDGRAVVDPDADP